ncbi:cytochrome c [uncultured Lutibacter sp.]|uniref:c-type cytochrome n=1 Tax=uncultured Lutibacter sp. TaxID=437739 RepID=UPI0026308788|nr:cytochrome c [uncultured Lutibacter sp.]
MKNILKITIALAFTFIVSSCWSDKTKPNYQYMPDMYKSVGYETYSENPNHANGMTTQLPVEGTIARGQVPYDFDNTNEGYEAAKIDSKNPLELNEANLANGEKMYTIYCNTCHGKTGVGDGELVKRDKFLGVPNYKDREITEGSIYHVIMYGRNMMGSHASQLTAKERWQTTMYVQQLRTELLK